MNILSFLFRKNEKRKLTILFCIMYKFHNSHFVTFVVFINFVFPFSICFIFSYFVYFYCYIFSLFHRGPGRSRNLSLSRTETQTCPRTTDQYLLIIPARAKLSSTTLYHRICIKIDRHLSEEQALEREGHTPMHFMWSFFVPLN